jgi:DNA adenine methylase
MTQISSIQSGLKQTGEQGLAEHERPFAHPFVKWAGGKSQLVVKMRKHFPETFQRYYEPFLGGASVFFYLVHLRPHPFPATLSDTNRDLMNAYKVIQSNVEGLIKDLTKRQRAFREQPNKSARADHYLQVRGNPPNIDSENVERAGWFIFLNKTCYNGLYRVNSKGVFNVPYGDASPKTRLFDKQNLLAIHQLLNQEGIELVCDDYARVLEKTKANDFAYLDPPYYSANNKGFTAYTISIFSKDEQKALAEVVKILAEKGVKVLVSNADAEYIKELYEEKKPVGKTYYYDSVEALRVINCRGANRTGAKEILIKNF